MDAKQDQNDRTTHVPATASVPLSPLEARHAEDEARRHAATTGTELFQGQQHGKVEAETRRISEETTREAQARLRVAQSRQPSSAAGAPDDTPSVVPTAPVGVPAVRLPQPLTIKHVLVPLDGSAFAERALPCATAIARMTSAQVTLAHIDSVPGALDTLIAGASPDSRPTQAEVMRSQLELLRHQVPLPRQHVHIAVQRAPSPAQGIRDLEEEGLADLVVMSAHAREGIKRALFGSVVDELLRIGRAPVLVVSPLVAQLPEGKPDFAHVLVALDGSLLSEQALGALGGLLAMASHAQRTLRTITLLTVVAHPSLVEDGEAYLAEVRDALNARYAMHGLTIHTVTMVGDPAAIIASVAPRESAPANSTPAATALTADLLVLATHGRGGVGRWLLGSVTSRVLPRMALPVLLVHPLITEP